MATAAKHTQAYKPNPKAMPNENCFHCRRKKAARPKRQSSKPTCANLATFSISRTLSRTHHPPDAGSIAASTTARASNAAAVLAAIEPASGGWWVLDKVLLIEKV